MRPIQQSIKCQRLITITWTKLILFTIPIKWSSSELLPTILLFWLLNVNKSLNFLSGGSIPKFRSKILAVLFLLAINSIAIVVFPEPSGPISTMKSLFILHLNSFFFKFQNVTYSTWHRDYDLTIIHDNYPWIWVHLFYYTDTIRKYLSVQSIYFFS